MDAITSAAIVLALGAMGLGVTLIGARRLGLTDVQRARAGEEARTLQAIKDRLAIVERRADEQGREIEQLKATLAQRDAKIAEQAQELADLHELITDGALDALRDIVEQRRQRAYPRTRPRTAPRPEGARDDR